MIFADDAIKTISQMPQLKDILSNKSKATNKSSPFQGHPLPLGAKKKKTSKCRFVIKELQKRGVGGGVSVKLTQSLSGRGRSREDLRKSTKSCPIFYYFFLINCWSSGVASGCVDTVVQSPLLGFLIIGWCRLPFRQSSTILFFLQGEKNIYRVRGAIP